MVRGAPPREIVERIPSSPGRDYVWLPGYWAAERERWVWVSGRWAKPPRANARYERPHWEAHGEEFHFSVGVWR